MYHFLTFGTEKYYPSVKRITEEAINSKVFSSVTSILDSDIKESYYDSYPHIFDPSARGKHGYWGWKPFIILNKLNEIPDGDSVMYLDSRSHFCGNEKEKERIEELFSLTEYVLAHHLSDPERGWTKRETLKFFGIDETPEMETLQRMGGIVFVRNNERSRAFIKEWFDTIINHFEIVNDSKDLNNQHPHFIDHRHDQSIFSILTKREGFPARPIHTLNGLIRFHYS